MIYNKLTQWFYLKNKQYVQLFKKTLGKNS